MQVAGLLPLLTACVAPLGRVMKMFLIQRPLHGENVFVLVEEVLTVAYHELSTCL